MNILFLILFLTFFPFSVLAVCFLWPDFFYCLALLFKILCIKIVWIVLIQAPGRSATSKEDYDFPESVEPNLALLFRYRSLFSPLHISTRVESSLLYVLLMVIFPLWSHICVSVIRDLNPPGHTLSLSLSSGTFSIARPSEVWLVLAWYNRIHMYPYLLFYLRKTWLFNPKGSSICSGSTFWFSYCNVFFYCWTFHVLILLSLPCRLGQTHSFAQVLSPI